MSKIDVNPEILESSAVRASCAATDMRQAAARIDRARENVEAGWQSQYTGLYTSELEVLKNNMDRLSDSIQQLSDSLKDSASKIRRAEEANRELFRNRGGGGGGAF